MLDAFFSTKMNMELNKKLCIIEFPEIRQKDGESITEFANRLRRAAVPCEFGDTAEEEIKRQLFRGTKDQTVRKEVLAATDKDSVDDILSRVREIALIESSIRATGKKTPVINHEMEIERRIVESVLIAAVVTPIKVNVLRWVRRATSVVKETTLRDAVRRGNGESMDFSAWLKVRRTTTFR